MNTNRTQVFILGTLHGFHRDNANYSFEDVFSLVKSFQPDIIGIEIRPEDMDQESDYLKQYYPYEMIEIRQRFQASYPIVGFDWYNQKLEGQLIPPNFFESYEQVLLEKDFEVDPDVTREREIEQLFEEKILALIKDKSPAEVNDGKLDNVIELKQAVMSKLLAHTKYRALYQAYQKRDENIDQNIIQIIKQHQGKRLVFVMGAAHRVYAIQQIKAHFGEQVNIIPVNEITK